MTPETRVTQYRIGIDVGENSVGLAAISYDDDDHVIEVLSCLSYIHDGGKLSGTDKAPISRQAGAGVARRTRRLRRRSQKRLRELESFLSETGYPPIQSAQTYDAWQARYQLIRGYVEDESERNHKLALVIRHIARHRGWRNPWWSLAQVQRKAMNESPSTSLQKMWDNAISRYEFSAEEICSVGTLGYLGVTRGHINRRLRHSTNEEKKNRENIFFDRIMAEDNYWELDRILEIQRVSSETSSKILEHVFIQKKPHVPKDRVGDDPLVPSQKRSTRAGLEFQRVRLLNAISNLRVTEGGVTRELIQEEYEKALEFLGNWNDKATRPNQSDVAHILGIKPAHLKFPVWNEELGSIAFCDETSIQILKTFSSKDPLGAWWRSATFFEKSDFIDFITDTSEELDSEDSTFIRFLEDEETMESINTLSLSSGRAAYSRNTYQQILPVMERDRCSEREAIKTVFEIDDNWRPPLPNIDDPMEQPTVDRILTVVRRFAMACNSKWGIPQSITIEHVRNAFMGSSNLAKLKYEIAQRTQKNNELRERLQASSSGKIRKADLKKERQIQRQNSACLYCGTTLSFESCQMDHIVPQADGGSNREENLVACCPNCNLSKGALPFVTWARTNVKTEVQIDEAIARLKTWERGGIPKAAWSRYLKNVESRLTLEESDDGPDERALASTAYAALEVRNRLKSLYSQTLKLPEEDRPLIRVYSGSINSIARRSSGIDDFLLLRNKTEKSRLDRRHHAIDAAMLTTLNDSVAITLAHKLNRQRYELDANKGSTRWKDFEGTSPKFIENYHHWQSTCRSLADEMKREIDRDRIPVVRPLRINPTSGEGAVHDDTIRPLVTVDCKEGLTGEQVRRLSSPKLFDRASDSLEEDYSLTAANATRIFGSEVKLFAGAAAQIPVRGGSVQIGNSLHHARVYAFRKKDKIKYGWVRVFAGEFPHIGFSKAGVDVLRQPIPFNSQSMLKANQTLVKLIQSGEAKEIGWVTQNDEIEFDLPEDLIDSEDENSAVLPTFLKTFPERRWIITGLESEIQLKISPSILSSEGVTPEHPQLIADIISRKAYVRLGVNPFLSLPNIKIIRRSILGTPRWRNDGLPHSWSPLLEATKVFGE